MPPDGSHFMTILRNNSVLTQGQSQLTKSVYPKKNFLPTTSIYRWPIPLKYPAVNVLTMFFQSSRLSTVNSSFSYIAQTETVH